MYSLLLRYIWLLLFLQWNAYHVVYTQVHYLDPPSWEFFSRSALLLDPFGTLSEAKCTSSNAILLPGIYEYKNDNTGQRQHRKALPNSDLPGNGATAFTINEPASQLHSSLLKDFIPSTYLVWISRLLLNKPLGP